jgi:beta-glucanase (GH16 family)
VTDDFDGTSLDPARWIVYDSPDAKVNPRTRAATSVSGGELRLVGGIYGGKDLSGGVASTYLQTYGRWEVRLRAAAGAGYSPVALLWPQNMGHPEYAEIDFTEILDPTRQSAGIYIHHGPRDDQAQRQMRADFTQWHVVAVDWLPTSLTFWLDGKQVWTYRGPLIPHRDKMGLALQNDQVCDRGPAFCRDRTTPEWVPMEVDWVRIYRMPS